MNKNLSIIFMSIMLVINYCNPGNANNANSPNTNVNPGKYQAAPGIFYSHSIKNNFRIYVALPENYDSNDSRKYHVIYLLDGDWYFDGSHERLGNGGVKGIISRLADQEVMPEVILVGIGYNGTGKNQRGRDFLYGYRNFFSFLEDELVPFMDMNYNTQTESSSGRTLIGHSDGGYFTMYVFFKYSNELDNLFRNFISLSGDFTKSFIDLFHEEEMMFGRIGSNKILQSTLYLAVGGSEEDRFVNSFYEMEGMLNSRNYNQFSFASHLYPRHDHGSVVGPAITDGLIFIFQSKGE